MEPPEPPSIATTRRRFLSRLSLGLAAAAAALAAVPVAGFLSSILFRKLPQAWRSVGRVETFEIGKTVPVTFENAEPLPWSGVAARTAAWLRRVSETEFIAFDLHCTHLGCPVTWLADAELFMCPCHGGVYTQDGAVVAGPPPHPLTRHEVRIRNGSVEIRTKGIPIV